MAIEEARLRLRRRLEEMFGVEEASILMDRPPGGWNDLVTNHTLDLKLDVLRHELRGEMAQLRMELRTDMADLSASVDRRLRAQAHGPTRSWERGFRSRTGAAAINGELPSPREVPVSMTTPGSAEKVRRAEAVPPEEVSKPR